LAVSLRFGPVYGQHPAQTLFSRDQRIAMLQGKIIGITGIIELRQGKPEIKVTSGDQIKGLDPQQVQ
jgi:DNA/RNA endonuclease YhcR with UshA esterase domain